MSAELNPYQAPQHVVPSRADALNLLRIPSIALLILAGISCLYILLAAGELFPLLDVADAKFRAGYLLVVCGWLGATLFVMWGSICMLRGKRYGVAIYSAIVACVPIASPCIVLGIPFGIWALVVLCRQSVEDGFQS